MDAAAPLQAGSENDRKRLTLAGILRRVASLVGFAIWLLVFRQAQLHALPARKPA